MAHQDEDGLLTEQQVAELIGWSRRTLQRRRWQGETPAFVKVGASVRYRRSVIEAFIAAGERTSTAASAAA